MKAVPPSNPHQRSSLNPVALFQVGVAPLESPATSSIDPSPAAELIFTKILATSGEEAIDEVQFRAGPDRTTTLSSPLVFNVQEPTIEQLGKFLRGAGITYDILDTRLARPSALPLPPMRIPPADLTLETRLRVLRARYTSWWEFVNEVQSLSTRKWPVVRSVTHPYHLAW